MIDRTWDPITEIYPPQSYIILVRLKGFLYLTYLSCIHDDKGKSSLE